MIEEVMAIEEPAMEQTLSGNNSGMMEKTISVNGTDRAYTMKSDYETCPIIENIKDETYDDNHYSYLLDIDNYDNVDFLKRLERA